MQASLKLAVSKETELAEVFYRRLFEAYPQLRPLFPADMSAQKSKITTMLVWIVDNLRSPDKVRDELRAMGQRHVGYGVKPEHYPLVRDQLLHSIGDVSGDDWSDELRADWGTAIDMIAAHMLAGAKE